MIRAKCLWFFIAGCLMRFARHLLWYFLHSHQQNRYRLGSAGASGKCLPALDRNTTVPASDWQPQRAPANKYRFCWCSYLYLEWLPRCLHTSRCISTWDNAEEMRCRRWRRCFPIRIQISKLWEEISVHRMEAFGFEAKKFAQLTTEDGTLDPNPGLLPSYKHEHSALLSTFIPTVSLRFRFLSLHRYESSMLMLTNAS